jgi:hypothetical protein
VTPEPLDNKEESLGVATGFVLVHMRRPTRRSARSALTPELAERTLGLGCRRRGLALGRSQHRHVNEALKDKGMSKERAAKISNAQAKKQKSKS